MAYEIIGIEKIPSTKAWYGIRVKNLNYDPKSGYQESWVINIHTLKTKTEGVCEFLSVDSVDKWINEIEALMCVG